MNTLTKLAPGLMGQVKPRPAMGASTARIKLPPPTRDGGMPLICDEQLLLAQTVGVARGGDQARGR